MDPKRRVPRGGMGVLIAAMGSWLPSPSGLVVPDQLELSGASTTSVAGKAPEGRNMQTVLGARTRKILCRAVGLCLG